MVVGNFNIIIVCANVERDGDIPLYGDIYTDLDESINWAEAHK